MDSTKTTRKPLPIHLTRSESIVTYLLRTLSSWQDGQKYSCPAPSSGGPGHREEMGPNALCAGDGLFAIEMFRSWKRTGPTTKIRSNNGPEVGTARGRPQCRRRNRRFLLLFKGKLHLYCQPRFVPRPEAAKTSSEDSSNANPIAMNRGQQIGTVDKAFTPSHTPVQPSSSLAISASTFLIMRLNNDNISSRRTASQIRPILQTKNSSSIPVHLAFIQ